MAGRRQSMTQNIINGKKSGFTLLELLLVIGIIAALVGLAVPYYQDYVGQSKNSIMQANLHLLKKTLMEFKADTGYFPATNDLKTKLVPRYLMALPEDPEAGSLADWGYKCDAASCSFDGKYKAFFPDSEVVGGRPIIRKNL